MAAANPETASVLLSTPKKCVHLHVVKTTLRWRARLSASLEELNDTVFDKKINKGTRLSLGTHKTKYLAARCQDRATLMIKHRFGRGPDDKPLKLNFNEADYEEDEDLRNSLSVEAFIELLKSESRESYKTTQNKSKCLVKFLADVEQGRVAHEIEPLAAQISQTEDIKKKMKLEPRSAVGPKISDEEKAKLFAAKQYCAICKKVWLTDEKGNFAQCDTWMLWVHAPCANLTKKKLKELGNGTSYHCPGCQRAHSFNISSQDQQNLDMIKLADKKENSEPAKEKLLQSTPIRASARMSLRRKRILDNTAPPAKVAKTCGSRPEVSRPSKQTNVASSSSMEMSPIPEIDFNLRDVVDAELSEAEFQAAMILWHLKIQSSNRPEDRIAIQMSHPLDLYVDLCRDKYE